MDSEGRSRDTRERAQEALVRFALLASGHTNDFVVIGGLNPDFLAPTAPTPHQGTTDVDLLFELEMIFDRENQDFGWLDRLLAQPMFTEKTGSSGWQWNAILGEALVRFDILCDVADSPGQTLALPGARIAAAQNLDGPAAALRDPVRRMLAVSSRVKSDFPNAPDTVELTFASLGGYLAAKASALVSRRLSKDAYDLMYVVLYNPDGPQGAADAAKGMGEFETIIRSAVGSFLLAESERAREFAQTMIEAGDESTEEQLEVDATVGAQRFIERLEQR